MPPHATTMNCATNDKDRRQSWLLWLPLYFVFSSSPRSLRSGLLFGRFDIIVVRRRVACVCVSASFLLTLFPTPGEEEERICVACWNGKLHPVFAPLRSGKKSNSHCCCEVDQKVGENSKKQDGAEHFIGIFSTESLFDRLFDFAKSGIARSRCLPFLSVDQLNSNTFGLVGHL